jgi:hypothetical protein
MKTAPSGVGFSIASSYSALPQEKSANPRLKKQLPRLERK